LEKANWPKFKNVAHLQQRNEHPMVLSIILAFALGALLATLFRIFILAMATFVALVVVGVDQTLIGHTFARATIACIAVAIAIQMGFLAGQIPGLFRHVKLLRLSDRPFTHN
jgi:hypothetical protein